MENSLVKILGKEEKIDLNEVFSFVAVPESGGVNFFIGTVRNHTKGKNVLFLDYEAYENMALKELNAIAAEVAEKFLTKKLYCAHRTGRLYAGEEAVVIAVSCPHRVASFDACRYVIEEIKKRVPIWKKEYFEDGDVWVSAFP
jgi:molybdopterin synthase catalytic subunit